MKYKVGDVVRVRDDLQEREKRGIDVYVAKQMLNYRGKSVTIDNINTTHKEPFYEIEEDGHYWCWCDWMFEDETKELKEYLTKLCESVQK